MRENIRYINSTRGISTNKKRCPPVVIVQELCESQGGRPGLSILTSYTEPCFGTGLSLSLICQPTSEDIKQHNRTELFGLVWYIYIPSISGTPSDTGVHRHKTEPIFFQDQTQSFVLWLQVDALCEESSRTKNTLQVGLPIRPGNPSNSKILHR